MYDVVEYLSANIKEIICSNSIFKREKKMVGEASLIYLFLLMVNVKFTLTSK